MQLSVSSGKHGLIQRATFLAFGDSNDHTTDWPLADAVASANRWKQQVSTWLWQALGIWELDDSNQTDLPVPTTTLVNNQQDYSLPADLVKLNRVEVKDNSGNFHLVRQFDETEITNQALSEYRKTSGLPSWYRVEYNSVFLYPPPDNGVSVTLAAGLRLYYAREFTFFTVPASYTTADTTQPGFNEMWHDIVCLGMAYDWCNTNGPQDRADRYFAQIQGLKQDLFKHEGAKNRDKKVAIMPRVERYE